MFKKYFNIFNRVKIPKEYYLDFMISDEDVEQNSCYQYTSEQLARELFVPHEILLIKLGDMNSRGYDFNLCFTPRSDFLGR